MTKFESGTRLLGKIKSGTDENPLVSIITVTYNLIQGKREFFFRQMMDSVINQDYGRGNIEHIIVDGGSEDGTLDLIKDYDEKGYVDYWLSERDSGIYEAMNKGIKVSKGTIIGILNSDDYFNKDAISSVMDKFNEKVDFFILKKLYLNKNGSKIKTFGLRHYDERVYFRIPFPHNSTFIKKQIYEELGFYDETYKYVADWKFFQNLYINNKKFCYIEKVGVNFTYGGATASNLDAVRKEQTRLFQENFNIDSEMALFFSSYSEESSLEDFIKKSNLLIERYGDFAPKELLKGIILYISKKSRENLLLENLKNKEFRSLIITFIKKLNLYFPLKQLKTKLDAINKL